MTRHAVTAVLAAAALCACSGAAAAAPGLVKVAGSYSQPLLVTAPAGDARIFVVEQTGKVRIVSRGRVLPRPFLDVSGRISNGGEQGLLGLAFHPQYAQNGRFYVNYTDRSGNTRVVEYRRGTNPNRANPGSARQILFVSQPFPNHNGGHLAFGPDGKLYIGLGDGGSGQDPLDSGQRLDTLLGKILRIDVDARAGGKAYAVPGDNPFVGRAGARPEIWHYGLRNPWRFSFDRSTGDMWIGDVGQNAVEEVDFRAASAGGGANFGWRAFEGTRPGFGAANGPVVPPVFEYSHAKGCSITGGHVYRGKRVTSLAGRYVVADYCSGRVWSLRAGPNPGAAREITARFGGRLANVTSFGEDAAGELYATAGGAVYRFVER